MHAKEEIMDWKEIIKKIRLVDIQLRIKNLFKAKQFGLVNVENNYTINMTEEMAKKFIDAKITDGLEKMVKEITLKKLSAIAHEMDLLPESTIGSVVVTTMTSTMLEVSSAEHVVVSDHATLKIE
jgi:hypothetical protein